MSPFPAGNFGSLKTQIPQIKLSGEKKTSTAWQGLLGHVCQFQGHLKKTKKRRGNWMLIWSDMLEPACTRVVYRLHRKIFYYFMRAKSVSCIIHGSIYTRTDCIRIRTRDRSTWCVVRRTYHENSRELQDYWKCARKCCMHRANIEKCDYATRARTL